MYWYHSNTAEDVGRRWLKNIEADAGATWRKLYAPKGIRIAMSFCALHAPPENFAAEAKAAAELFAKFRALGVKIIPWSAFFGGHMPNETVETPTLLSTWELMAANLRVAAATPGLLDSTLRYVFDGEPYSYKVYPRLGLETLRVTAAMLPFLRAIDLTDLQVLYTPGVFGHSSANYTFGAVLRMARRAVTSVNQYGSNLPYQPALNWEWNDAEAAACAALGIPNMPMFYERALRNPLPVLKAGLAERPYTRNALLFPCLAPEHANALDNWKRNFGTAAYWQFREATAADA